MHEQINIAGEIVLGIDGGGTKTHAAIVDSSGRVLGMGQGGPSTYDDVGVEGAKRSIAEAVEQARRAAGLPAGQPFAAAFLGLGGVVSDHDRRVIRGIAGDLRLADDAYTGVDHDCRVALAGGLSGRPGIVQILGTGSSTYGRTADGQSWRSGGWGHLLADEGSSYWLGLHAMRLAVMAYDGRGQPTLLLPRVMETLRLSDINEIMHRLYVPGMPRAEIAALAPLVTAAAEEGDSAAAQLIDQGAQALGECVLAVARRLGFDSAPRCEVALVGGLLKAGAVIRQPIEAAIRQRLPNSLVLLAENPPVLGACLLAWESLGKAETLNFSSNNI